jgi:hypothetical protein
MTQERDPYEGTPAAEQNAPAAAPEAPEPEPGYRSPDGPSPFERAADALEQLKAERPVLAWQLTNALYGCTADELHTLFCTDPPEAITTAPARVSAAERFNPASTLRPEGYVHDPNDPTARWDDRGYRIRDDGSVSPGPSMSER